MYLGKPKERFLCKSESLSPGAGNIPDPKNGSSCSMFRKLARQTATWRLDSGTESRAWILWGTDLTTRPRGGDPC